MLTFDEPTHTYRWNGQPVPNVTRLLAPLTDYSRIPADVLERAQQEGKAIHKMVELHMTGMLDLAALHSDESQAWLLPRFEALEKFIDETGFVCYAAEHPLYSKQLRYAGTPDLIGRMSHIGKTRRRAVLVDVKRSFFAGPVIGLQTAAYTQVWNETEAKGEKDLLVPNQNRFALQLRADGTYRLEPFDDGGDFAAFLALLTVHYWKENHYGRQ